MRLRGSTATLATAVAIVMVASASFGVVAAGLGAMDGLVGANADLSLTSTFYEKSLPAGQLSPYCNVGVIIACYSPDDLRVAYNYPSAPTLSGWGQTIVLLDAFGYPSIQSDLNTFDSEFGIPALTLDIVCQGGTCPTFHPNNPDEVSWAHEISLDVEYSHAMAPSAHIVLFVAKNDDVLNLEKAAKMAVKMFPNSILSQSFGIPELALLGQPTSYVNAVLQTGESAYTIAEHTGTTVFASAGDYGGANNAYGFSTANPSYPSSSPLVTAVGGTMGNPYLFGSLATCSPKVCSTGLVEFKNNAACDLSSPSPPPTASCTPVGYGSEQVWNEPAFQAGGYGVATGGAPSFLFGVPSYQHGLGLTSRATPDISYDAAVGGGVLTYWSAVPSEAGFYITGGTSAGSPQWAAITAIADQWSEEHGGSTLGFLNPALYTIGENPAIYATTFHDITVGNNAAFPSDDGFNATTGWDDASGWGTPNVSNLVPWLVALA
jgi:subtilase family serine protease